ncbi:hypothetical protein HF1_02750 [Mycoplasma haemofelis str. Langford 1]|uniref:Uncharacterized protein n=1 Tax=Mycoplasma haemofelis (strain Langford 1) TaxID=941640 RepID=E8ZGL2_MYCHL|nr:hypothetical protein [Mycoplasma haemofelis]CBY92283.1 hypothetical protein HF1_02750 [Mycoplasma haemofelis str. Langford 1]
MEPSKIRPKPVKEVKAVRRRLVGGNPNASNSHLEEYLSKSKACFSIWKKLLVFYIVLIVLAVVSMGVGVYGILNGSGDSGSGMPAVAMTLIVVLLVCVLIFLIMGAISISRIISTFLCIGRTVELVDDTKVKASLKEGRNILGLMMASMVTYAIPGINAIGFIANWICKYLYYKSYKRIAE